MPCTEVFDAQDEAYRDSVLPAGRQAAPGGRGGRHADAGGATSALKGRVLGIDRFGASGKAAEVFPHFGFTADNVVEAGTESARELASGTACKRVVFFQGDDMAIKVGINGYGRIGRNVLRALYESKRTAEVADRRASTIWATRKTQRAPDPLRHRARQVSRRGAASTATPWSSTATASGCSPSAIRPSCPGASSAPTSCSSAPGSSPARRRPART